MPDRRELELHLAAAGYASRIVVDGVELSNIQSATVRADVHSLTTVEIVYIPFKTPFVLRGQMVVVYDGPTDEETPAPRTIQCGNCGRTVRSTNPHYGEWYELPTMTRCPACRVAMEQEYKP